MDILRGYGLGKNLKRPLQHFGDDQAVVLNAGRFYGRLFGTEIGVTQGDLVSPTIFNIVVENINGDNVERVTHQVTVKNHGEAGALDGGQDVGDTVGRGSAGSDGDTVSGHLHYLETGEDGSVGGAAANI